MKALLIALALIAPVTASAASNNPTLDKLLEQRQRTLDAAQEADEHVVNLICERREDNPNCHREMMSFIKRYKQNAINLHRLEENFDKLMRQMPSGVTLHDNDPVSYPAGSLGGVSWEEPVPSNQAMVAGFF